MNITEEMEFYLCYLEKYEKVEVKNLPIGLIFCSGKNEEHIELLDLDKLISVWQNTSRSSPLWNF